MIAIDTQALVWYFQGDERLGSGAIQLIETQRATRIVIPTIVAWEIAMLVDKERIALGLTPSLWFAHVLTTRGFEFGSFGVELGLDAGSLPGRIHGDPGDRLVIATARALDCPLLTSDEKILAYAANKHLKAIDARV